VPIHGRIDSMKLSDEIRRAIESCGRSRNSVCVEAGLDPAAVCNFVAGRRGLSMDSLDKLAAVLDLHILASPQRGQKLGRTTRSAKTATSPGRQRRRADPGKSGGRHGGQEDSS